MVPAFGLADRRGCRSEAPTGGERPLERPPGLLCGRFRHRRRFARSVHRKPVPPRRVPAVGPVGVRVGAAVVTDAATASTATVSARIATIRPATTTIEVPSTAAIPSTAETRTAETSAAVTGTAAAHPKAAYAEAANHGAAHAGAAHAGAGDDGADDDVAATTKAGTVRASGVVGVASAVVRAGPVTSPTAAGAPARRRTSGAQAL